MRLEAWCALRAGGLRRAGDAVTSLSTHVLDLERGVPAAGVHVVLYAGDRAVREASTNADGRIPDLADALAEGVYALVFDVAGYLADQARPAPFLQSVRIQFRVHAADSHYHVPLLLSPYACTSYRGS
jgi:hydroxyisourate hydrolase